MAISSGNKGPKKMARKIIQIAAVPSFKNETLDALYALTDEGEVYVLSDPGNHGKQQWWKLPAIGDGVQVTEAKKDG